MSVLGHAMVDHQPSPEEILMATNAQVALLTQQLAAMQQAQAAQGARPAGPQPRMPPPASYSGKGVTIDAFARDVEMQIL